MKPILLLLPLLALGGCVSAQTSVFYGRFEVPADRPLSFCENYAHQTYRNVLIDTYDRGNGFGAREFSRTQARRAADRAYERCLAGRLN